MAKNVNKRTQTYNDFLEQAERDSKDTSKVPLVSYKGDYKKFLVIGDAKHLLPILSEHIAI